MNRPSLFSVPDWVIIAGLAIMAVALFWLMALIGLRIRDRHRSRERHCPHCFYNMSGTPGFKCPECGHEAREERELHRAPHRWRPMALAALLAIVGGTMAAGRLLAQVNWIGLAPTRLLLSVVESTAWTSAYGGQTTIESLAREELWLRDARDRLSESSRRELVRKQFALRPPVRIDTRSRWPSGATVTCDVLADMGGARPRELTVLRSDTGARMLRTAIDSGVYLPGVSLSRLGGASSVPPRFSLGEFADGEHRVEFTLELRERGRLVWTGVAHTTFTVGGTIEQVIKPLSSGECDRILESTVRGGLWLSPDRTLVGIGVPLNTIGARICFPLRVEFLRHTRVQAAADLVGSTWPGTPPGSSAHGAAPLNWWALLSTLDPAFTTANLTDGSWTVRITADPALALRDFDADTCWSGKLEFPAKAVLKPVPGLSP